MISKKIHYCWFGGNPLDAKAINCIESWKKFFPDYEIIQWDESNFDVTQVDFMEKAYRNKKWAFVSDVARLLIVYENGGMYFDTDVEVVHSYDDILNVSGKAFMGMESEGMVNTGLGFGAEKSHPFLKKCLEVYKQLDYEEYKDHISDIACPILTTRLLESAGFIKEDRIQSVEEVDIYPTTYFAPMDYQTGKIKLTDKTHSIHWYNASWQDESTKKEQEKLRKLKAVVGNTLAETLYGIVFCIKREGVLGYIVHRIKKLFVRKAK